MTRVLVVDDTPDTVKLLRSHLNNQGYDVSVAHSGAEALEVASAERPDVILLDVMMPEMDGIEVCRRLKADATLRNIPVILVTAKDLDDDVVQGLNAGADDYVAKPFNMQVLTARLRSAVRVKESHDTIAQVNKRLRLLASHDPLTGLLNRRTFFRLFQTEWVRARRIDYPLSCAMIDVDHFKRVNDSYGHLTGDAVLKSIARLLKEYCRETDAVGRYGGEEFSLLLPDTDEQGAVICAERCRKAIADTAIVANGTNIHVTISAGVAQQCEGASNPQELLDLADRALLAAKRQGRNRVVAFGSLQPGYLRAMEVCGNRTGADPARRGESYD